MNEPQKAGNIRVTISIVSVGLTSLVTQIVLLREFLSIFYGNELVIGVLLANWMILTGVGAYLGRYMRLKSSAGLAVVLILMGIFPYLTVLLLRLLRNLVFPVGVIVGFVPILLSSFVLLMPFCILSGASFSMIAGFKPRTGEGQVGGLYAWEAVGSVIGGLLFSLVLFHYLQTFQSLAVLMVVDFAAALFVVYDRKPARDLVWVLSIVLLIPALLVHIDRVTRMWLFPDQTIMFAEDTPYGNLTVTRQAEQQNFYENGILVGTTKDPATAEESVHYALLQRDFVRSVLMVSGGVTGAVQEVFKYTVDTLDYVEVNPALLELAKSQEPSLSDKRVNSIAIDPRVFVRGSRSKYDAVLLNIPEPSTLQLNRLYTLEFFELLRGCMNPNGILSLALLPSTDYSSEESRGINSTMMNTMKALFKEVLIIPGQRTFFLGSDGTLSTHIGELAAARGRNNAYVNKYYIDDEVLSQRSTLLLKSLRADAPLNRDFAPASYYRQITHWLSYFRDDLWLVGGITLVFLLVAAVQMNAVSSGVFAGGFAASSMEVMFLMAFQILYGYVYEMLGLIVAVFMGGLAVGSFWRSNIVPHVTVRSYAAIQIAVGVFCISIPKTLSMLRANEGSTLLVHGVIVLSTFIIAGLVGTLFASAAELRKGHAQRIASELYGVDLIGSAIGALLIAAVLIPWLGFAAAGIVPGVLSLVTAVVALMRRTSIERSVVEVTT